MAEASTFTQNRATGTRNTLHIKQPDKEQNTRKNRRGALGVRCPSTVTLQRWEPRLLPWGRLQAMAEGGDRRDASGSLELKRWSWESRDAKVISGCRCVRPGWAAQVESPEMWRGSASDEVWAEHACAEIFEWREPFKKMRSKRVWHSCRSGNSVYSYYQIGKPQNSQRTKHNTQGSLASVEGNKYP